MHTAYSIKNSSIQGPNSVQTWDRNIYCRLAVVAQPQRRQRCTYLRHGHIQVDTIQSTTDIPHCMSILQIQLTTVQDKYLQYLKKCGNCRLAKHK